MRLDVFRDKQYLGGYNIGTTSEVRIGRGIKNQIILPDSEVSRKHARLVRHGSGYMLIDESRNGTLMKGKKVNNVRLENGDEFQIGSFKIKLDDDVDDWDQPTEESRVLEKESFQGIVGTSPAIRNLFEFIKRVSDSDGTVLINGETGTGKELVARAVHALGVRAKGHFVAINCSAISPDLVESELFGHEKGSFTGAVKSRKGAFEQANGGTLFLDEVGDLSLDLQPKLLRVLEDGVIRRVGSQIENEVDVRVVAATHRDLKEEVDNGNFRADLLYRLFVLPLFVPPLRERKEDIELLTRHFMGSRGELVPEAQQYLVDHPWPGNVRELKNVLERACIMKVDGSIEPGDLIFLDEEGTKPEFSDDHSLEDLEKMYYSRALEKSDGSIRAAAKSLGIPKSTFFDRLKKYGLNKSQDD
jgi:transcriptional regulator with GAF, ATPase, and Fis domain